jgi:hypothetical protein
MIKSVVREYKFSPTDVGNLYIDEIDYRGLVFWYNDCLKINKDLTAKK